MRKTIATTIMVLVLACTTVFLLSACTLFQSNENKDLATADQGFDEWYGVANTTDESHYLMGWVFQERKKHHLAIEEFKMAVQTDPGNVAAYNGLGVSLDALGDHERAVAAYTAALAVEQNLDYVLNNLGYSYLLQGRPDLAIESFKKAVALDGKNQRYRNNLGLAYAKSGKYDAAFTAFKAGGDEAGAHLNIARLYYRSGRYEKAAVHFARASALKPSDADTDKGLAAATSLAHIHASSKNPLEKKEAPQAQKAEKQMAWYDDDGFYTIPAGAIEDLEIVKIDQINLAEKSYDSLNEENQPIYTVTLARIASQEEEQATTRKALEAKRLKILDEDQALELLNLEAADSENRPGIRVKIEVSNGNGVRRMARRVGNYLRDKGFILMYLSNASHFNHDETSIYYARGYLREGYRLSQELPGFQSLEEVPAIRNGNAEISILIGRDLTDHLSLFEQRQAADSLVF